MPTFFNSIIVIFVIGFVLVIFLSCCRTNRIIYHYLHCFLLYVIFCIATVIIVIAEPVEPVDFAISIITIGLQNCNLSYCLFR